MLLRAEALSKSFGPNDVLRSVTLQIDEGDAVGLVGRNGVGKTTLLRMLIGQMRPDTGELTLDAKSIGYLPQFPDVPEDMTVGQVVGTPNGDLRSLEDRMAELDGLMASGGDVDWNHVAEEYSTLERERDSLTGVVVSPQGGKALAKLGLDDSIAERRFSDLSGGERTKVMLARVIVQAEGSDLLFLDEPTSHLDVGTVEWLEDYLLKYRGGLLVVSHDRYFLDRVVTSVVDLEGGTLRRFKGNYSQFVAKKDMETSKQYKASERARIERDRLERIAKDKFSRNQYSGEHKRYQRMADSVEQVDRPVTKSMDLRIESGNKSGKNVIMSDGFSVSRDGREIVRDVRMDIEVGDKIGVFGPNGAGKSTLLKGIIGDLPIEGDLWVAPGANTGYFAQGHDGLHPAMTAEEELLAIMGKDERLRVRQLLARFLITGETAERPISSLSGGERGRVALAALMAEKRNLLILDEPTNYLDIPTKHAIESALLEYPGTMLIVTHDRYLLDAVCSKIIEVADGTTRMHNGNYSQMKGVIEQQKVEKAVAYKVVSGFTDWTTKRKYSAGDRVFISPAELKGFQWAIDNGKLKRVRGSERKKVRR